MLYDKQNLITLSDITKSDKKELTHCESQGTLEFLNGSLIAPFPFKVAKALDPNIYRNIEYDSWVEMRRGKLIF